MSSLKIFQLLTLSVIAILEIILLMTWEESGKLALHRALNLSEQALSNNYFGLFFIVERACLLAYLASILLHLSNLFQNLQKSNTSEDFRTQETLKEIGWVFLFSLLPLIALLICLEGLREVVSRRESAYTLSLLICAAFSLLLTLTERKKKTSVLRGEELLTEREARAISEELVQKDTPAFFWGGVWLPLEDSVKHMLIIGEPGSGKSKTIQMFTESILYRIGRGENHRAVLYDPKRNTRSLLAGMGLKCPVHLLDPFDKRSVAWDIAKDVDEPDIARTVAEALISEDSNTSQPYFRDTAAVVVCAVMQALHAKKPYAWTLRDLVLAMRSTESITNLVSRVPETKHYVAQHADEMSQAFQSVLSTAAGKIDWLASIAALWDGTKERISLRDWITNEESILLLGSDNLRSVAMAELNRMILTYLTLALLDLPDDKNRRIWVLLDEFTSLGKIKRVQDMLYKGRSKGASVLLAFQEIAQLIEHYGREGQRIITGNTANKIILRSSDPDTQKWEQSFFGYQEKYEESHSKNASLLGARASYGKSEGIRERSLVLPSEFGMLHLASRAKGISGFAKCPSIGSYRFNVPGDVVDLLSKPDPETPDFVPRAKEATKIKPFSKDEELKLYGEAAPINEIKSHTRTYQPKQNKKKDRIQDSLERLSKI
jgi:hypothetical protein